MTPTKHMGLFNCSTHSCSVAVGVPCGANVCAEMLRVVCFGVGAVVLPALDVAWVRCAGVGGRNHALRCALCPRRCPPPRRRSWSGRLLSTLHAVLNTTALWHPQRLAPTNMCAMCTTQPIDW